MQKSRRSQRYYDGTRLTSKNLNQLLPKALSRIGKHYEERPDLVMASWPTLVGEKLAPMTEAVSFEEGFLTVKVKNATLYSLLRQNERPKLLKRLRERFPKITIKNVIFRMG